MKTYEEAVRSFIVTSKSTKEDHKRIVDRLVSYNGLLIEVMSSHLTKTLIKQVQINTYALHVANAGECDISLADAVFQGIFTSALILGLEMNRVDLDSFQDHTDDSKCHICCGTSHVCSRCEHPEGECGCVLQLAEADWVSGYDPVVCETCGGTGSAA